MRYFLRVTRNSILATIFTFFYVQAPAGMPTPFGSEVSHNQLIDGQKATLRDLLIQLKNKYKVNILFDDGLVNQPANRALLAGNVTLEQSLTRILQPHKLYFKKVSENVYVITREKETKSRSTTVKTDSLVREEAFPGLPDTSKEARVSPQLESLNPGTPSPDRSVGGKVTDEKREPLPGVNILVKGTTRGLTTDVNGYFSIDVPNGEAVLVFSYVGYLSQEVMVGNRTNVEVSLVVDQKSLEEVVVVGYGTQRKASVTGSVSQVEGKDLINVPAATISSTLAGRLPGVVAIQRSGQPGSDNTSINIRGFGGALVIVDGVEQDYNQLDPREIETISVLKDASAAIFGARAGNGVILVTTKRGAAGKPKIDFSFSNGFQSNTRLPDLVDAGHYARALNDARRNAGNPIPFTDFQLKAYDYVSDRQNVAFTEPEQRQFDAERQNFANTDWVKTVFKPVASIQQYNINSRGGSETINYFLSLGYLNQQSVLKSGDNKFSRFNFRSNLDATISEGLTVSLDLGGRIENRGYPGYGMGDIWNGVFNDIPIKIVGADPAYPTGLGQATADASVSGTQKSTTKDFNGALSLNFMPSFIKGFQVKARFNYRNSDTFNKNFIKGYNVYNFDPLTGEYTVSRPGYTSQTALTENFWQGSYMTSQVYLNYDRSFGSHDVKAMVVAEYLDNKGNSLNAYRNNFLSGQVQQLFAGSAAGMTNTGGASQDGRISYASRINYAYMDRYLAEGTFRYDASPRFARDYRWGFFPGILLGWRISEEPFLKSIQTIDELKLRLSYGQSGVDNIANFNFLEGYNYSTGFVENGVLTTGIRSRGLANKSATWERHTTLNVAVDFEFFGRKIYGSADVFYKERSGVLAKRVDALPYSFGASLPSENLNSMTYRGFEIVLGHRRTTGSIRYSIEGNMAWNRVKNKVIQEPEYTEEYRRLRYQNSGQWANRYFGYTAEGLFQSQEEIDAWPVVQDNNNNRSLVPGDIKYVDFDGDGKLTDLDMTPIGRNNTPELTYGINVALSWKGVDFSMLWQGASRYGITMEGEQRTFPYNTSTIFEYNLDYWTPDNTTAKYPRIVAGGGASNNRLASTFWLHDASYMRLKNVQIGYAVPSDMLRNVKLSGFRVYVSAVNLLTLSNVPYYDPEAPSGSQWYFPQQKTISIGFNLNL